MHNSNNAIRRILKMEINFITIFYPVYIQLQNAVASKQLNIFLYHNSIVKLFRSSSMGWFCLSFVFVCFLFHFTGFPLYL